MKKIIAFTLALVMVLFCLAGCGSKNTNDTVMTVNGVDISWDEYMFWLGYGAMYLNYQYSMYGGQVDWTSEISEGVTAAQWCVDYATETVTQKGVLLSKCAEMGITLNEDEKAEVQKNIDDLKTQTCGENASDEQFEAFLKSNQYSNLKVLRASQEATVLTNKLFTALYGEDGANVSEDELLKAAEEQGYTMANHILFLFKDDEGNDRSDAEKAAGKAKLEGFMKELNAIEDNDQRYARFQELKEENCEDNGTDAYEFKEGTMVQEFYDMSIALEPYAMDIAETTYGYHLIIGLPLDLDYAVSGQSSSSSTLRETLLNDMYNDQLLKWKDEADIVTAKAFADYDFTTAFGSSGFIYQSWADKTAAKSK